MKCRILHSLAQDCLCVGSHVIKNIDAAQTTVQTINTLHGSLVALIFFWKSSQARSLWKRSFERLSVSLHHASSRVQSFYMKDSTLSPENANPTQISVTVSSQSRPDPLFTGSILNINDFFDDFRTSNMSEHMIGSTRSTPVTSARMQGDIVVQAMIPDVNLTETLSPINSMRTSM